MKTPYGTAPKKVSGDLITKIPPNGQELSDTPMIACVHRPSKGCSRRHQEQGVQKVCPTRTSSCVLHANEGSHLRNSFCSKSDQSLKTTIGEDAELCLPIWHLGMCKALCMHVSTALNAIKKRGIFKVYKEAVEAYVEQCKVVKQAKAALALLTAPPTS